MRPHRDYIAGSEWNNGCHPCAWWQPVRGGGGGGTPCQGDGSAPDARALVRPSLRPAQGMRWAGPGTAPATPDFVTLAQLTAQPGLWAPWNEGVRRALQRTQMELARRSGYDASERVVKAWAVVAHTSVGRQARAVACSPHAHAAPR